MKIVVLLPGGVYTMGFFRSWTRLVAALSADKDLQVSFKNLYSPVVYQGRNAMLLDGQEPTREAQPARGDYDRLFWLETDMVFDVEDFYSLLAADVDAVSAMYPMSTTLPTCAVAGIYSEGKEYRANIPLNLSNEKALSEVDFFGLGFVMMKRGVLEKIGYPWFNELYEERRGKIEYLGDEFSLCKQLRAHGVKLYLHTKVVVGHEKPIVLDGKT